MLPKDIKKIHQQEFLDSRGSLSIIFEGSLVSKNIVLKRSFSRKGVFRGMHHQNALVPQTKYVEVVSGEIIDFVICMDRSSDEYGKVFSELVSPGVTLCIPGSYAHGFYCKEETIFQYITDGEYSESSELVIKLDNDVLRDHDVTDQNIIFSDKDLDGVRYFDYFRKVPIPGDFDDK